MQTSVPSSQQVAQAGQIADLSNHSIESMSFADRETTAMVDTVTISTAVDGDTYTISVNGIETSVVAGPADTTATIATALSVAMNLVTGITDIVTPTNPVASTVVLTDAANGVFITLVSASTNTANISVAHTPAGVFADTEIPFGVGVFVGSGFDACILPFGAGTLAGVAVIDYTYGNTAEGGAAYRSGSPVGVMKKGRIWVRAEGSPAVTDSVFCRHTGNDTTEQRGAFRIDADGADAQAVTGCSWAGAARVTSNGERIALLNINLPA